MTGFGTASGTADSPASGAGSSASATFSPAVLFAGGAQGGWWDPSDITTLFQDSAGTTPVTASGQPVGRISDKSGRGNHLIQATAENRPTYTEAGTLRYLVFDGLTDALSVASFAMTASDKAMLAAAHRRSSNALTVFVEHSIDEAVNAGTLLHYWDATGSIGFGARGATINPTTATAARPAPETVVAAISLDLAGANAAAALFNPTLNGAAGLFTPAGPAPGGGNFGTFPLYVGARAGTLLPFGGNMYGLIVVGGTVSAANRAKVEQYLAGKSA